MSSEVTMLHLPVKMFESFTSDGVEIVLDVLTSL